MIDPNNLDDVIQFELESLFDALLDGVGKGKWNFDQCWLRLEEIDIMQRFIDHEELTGDFHGV